MPMARRGVRVVSVPDQLGAMMGAPPREPDDDDTEPSGVTLPLSVLAWFASRRRKRRNLRVNAQRQRYVDPRNAP